MPTLTVISGIGAGGHHPIDGRECLIGRDPMCDLVLNERTVSRQHARIIRSGDRAYIEDMGSVNGTYVNGERIRERTPLKESDQIRIYDIVLGFSSNSPSEEPTHQAAEVSATAAADRAHSFGAFLPGAEGMVRRQVEPSMSSASRLDAHPAAKLRALLEIMHSLESSLELDVLLPQILDSLFRIFPQAARGYILQADEAGGGLRPRAIKHSGPESDTISPISSKVAERVLARQTGFLSSDVLNDERLEEMSSSIFEDAEEVRSIMCAPLVGPSQSPSGVVQIETRDPRRAFTALDLEVLISVAFLAGQALEYSRLHAALLENDRRNRDLATARQVQLQFLPAQRPVVDGYEFFDYYHAADQVAGDYYDYIEMPDGRIGFAIGDVAGKGMPAALLMAHLCSDVGHALLTTGEPALAFAVVNRELARRMTESAFVTMVIGVLDPQRHTVTLANAGHPLPLVRRAGSHAVEMLGEQESGLPLTVEPETPYQQFTVEMFPGDLLFCYTDGVNEAMNPSGGLYGDRAVRQVLAGAGDEPAHVSRAVVADVRRFASGRLQSDDICLLCLARKH